MKAVKQYLFIVFPLKTWFEPRSLCPLVRHRNHWTRLLEYFKITLCLYVEISMNSFSHPLTTSSCLYFPLILIQPKHETKWKEYFIWKCNMNILKSPQRSEGAVSFFSFFWANFAVLLPKPFLKIRKKIEFHFMLQQMAAFFPAHNIRMTRDRRTCPIKSSWIMNNHFLPSSWQRRTKCCRGTKSYERFIK